MRRDQVERVLLQLRIHVEDVVELQIFELDRGFLRLALAERTVFEFAAEDRHGIHQFVRKTEHHHPALEIGLGASAVAGFVHLAHMHLADLEDDALIHGADVVLGPETVAHPAEPEGLDVLLEKSAVRLIVHVLEIVLQRLADKCVLVQVLHLRRELSHSPREEQNNRYSDWRDDQQNHAEYKRQHSLVHLLLRRQQLIQCLGRGPGRLRHVIPALI